MVQLSSCLLYVLWARWVHADMSLLQSCEVTADRDRQAVVFIQVKSAAFSVSYRFAVAGCSQTALCGAGASTPPSFCLASSDRHPWLSFSLLRPLFASSISNLPPPVTAAWDLSPFVSFGHPFSCLPCLWKSSPILCCLFSCSSIF